MISEPSVLTVDDFNKLFEQKKNWKEKIIFCSWCNESTFVRDVGPNYICYECEKKERAAGRPLVFTIPVRDAYFADDDFIKQMNKIATQSPDFSHGEVQYQETD